LGSTLAVAMLEVQLHRRRAGRLVRKKNGNLQFRYDADYLTEPSAVPLGQVLPLREEAFPHRVCLAFFANLLPEEEVLEHVARVLGISKTNDYLLLEQLGGDCAGAVTLAPAGAEAERGEPELQELSEAQLDELVDALEDRPLAIAPDGKPRLSLAGSQPKVPVIYDDGGGFSLPLTGEPPTTHILKPPRDRFPSLVDNEFFCMRLAKSVDLPVAEVERPETAGGTRFLLVTRYDRDLTHDPVRRLHQEDLCQALGKLPDEKYQAENGPTVRECMGLLNDVSAVPAQDRALLWSALVFNYLIANCDAHGKNFSLLYESRAPHLAPLYDLVSTDVYDLSNQLAMSIDGAAHLGETRRGSWERLAEEIGFSGLYASRALDGLSARVLERAAALAALPEHQSPVVEEIVSGIRRRAAAISTT
jgi:serine/threonine-protein kinase HipA